MHRLFSKLTQNARNVDPLARNVKAVNSRTVDSAGYYRRKAQSFLESGIKTNGQKRHTVIT